MKIKNKCLVREIFTGICILTLLSAAFSSKSYAQSHLAKSSRTNEHGEFRNLGVQVSENIVQASVFAKNKAGRTFLYTTVRGRTAHLVGVDIVTKNVVVNLPLEGSGGSWDMKVSKDGILYVSSSQGIVYKHIPGTQELDNLGRALPSETYLWDLAVGKNGEIFGATYPGCRVFRYHPNDGFSDVAKGNLVEGENYVRSIVYHEETDRIYAGVGSHAHLVELNPRTGEKREFLPDEYKKQEFVYNLSIVKDKKNGDKLLIYLTKSNKTLLYNIRTKVFQVEMEISNIYVKTAINARKESKAYFTAGSKLYEWNLKDLKPSIIGEVSSDALATEWLDNHNLLLFNRRNELIKYNVRSSEKHVEKLNIPALPLRMNYLSVGVDNLIWTGGYLVGSNATYNPETGVNTPYAGLSQTESMTFLGTNVYFGVYPNGRIYSYDTKKPWNLKSKNPRLLGKIEGQDRPFAGIAVEKLNKVYFGTVPSYGKNGGALVEYDIITDKLKSYSDVVYNQSIISLLYTDGILYGGSSNKGGLGIAPTEAEAKMFIWDPVANKKIRELIPVENAKSISCLAKSPDGKIWGMASGTIFIFDPVSEKVISKHKLFTHRGGGGWDASSIIFHSTGKIYAQEGGNLYKIEPKTMQFEILEKSAYHLIEDEKKTLFFVKDDDLWQFIPSKK